jgi:DNA-binding NtrC family response regulator
MRLLFAWIGTADLEAETNKTEGPILGALRQRLFDEVWLLCSWPEERVFRYQAWLGAAGTKTRIHRRSINLSQPNAFAEIYEHASAVVEEAIASKPQSPRLTFHLSPGTPVMASVWLILGTSRFPAELIESSRGSVNTVETPFNLPRPILPDLLHDPDRRLRESTVGRAQPSSGFEKITGDSEIMRRVVALAKKAAPRNVPLLIEGESGTGKELFAQAVHRASPRADKPMVIVNCGAIPETLIESRLFGHIKGAFTGAISSQAGCFEEADGGTLFLDEVGELSPSAQVALLRALQEGEVTRIGQNKVRKVNVRVIAATHRDLAAAIVRGQFREDLFYRLAVLRLRLPAIRERGSDLGLLIDQGLQMINEELGDDPMYASKSLSSDARQVLMQHQWRGNVRELHNTMRRALVWSDNNVLSAEDAEFALFSDTPSITNGAILERPLGPAFKLDTLLDEVAAHYIERAIKAAAGNKSKAAKLIGFASYQRLDKHCSRLGLTSPLDRVQRERPTPTIPDSKL